MNCEKCYHLTVCKFAPDPTCKLFVNKFDVQMLPARKYDIDRSMIPELTSHSCEFTPLLSDTDYWKQRCLLAEECLNQSPCDPDITSGQIKAHNAYNKFINWAGNKL